jgi:hypothetical protein|uniref:BLOC-1-related complex subunit 8 n=1 Tax=Panagrolaimus sp. PS1159 TaxID=55785 RepID=A0AC35FLY6_9BILA
MASKELQGRCKLIAEKLSESFHIVDHDPSMALYRLQEHVTKSIPVLVNRKYEVMKVNGALQGACYDMENSIEAINHMQKATPTFDSILEMLRQSTFIKQQMEYEKDRENQKSNAK